MSQRKYSYILTCPMDDDYPDIIEAESRRAALIKILGNYLVDNSDDESNLRGVTASIDNADTKLIATFQANGTELTEVIEIEILKIIKD